MLTKAIVEEQEHIGFACQTSRAQTRTESPYAFGELGVGNLWVGRLQSLASTNESRDRKRLPWWTKVNGVHLTQALRDLRRSRLLGQVGL
jgi:hypothetical protein